MAETMRRDVWKGKTARNGQGDRLSGKTCCCVNTGEICKARATGSLACVLRCNGKAIHAQEYHDGTVCMREMVREMEQRTEEGERGHGLEGRSGLWKQGWVETDRKRKSEHAQEMAGGEEGCA